MKVFSTSMPKAWRRTYGCWRGRTAVARCHKRWCLCCPLQQHAQTYNAIGAASICEQSAELVLSGRASSAWSAQCPSLSYPLNSQVILPSQVLCLRTSVLCHTVSTAISPHASRAINLTRQPIMRIAEDEAVEEFISRFYGCGEPKKQKSFGWVEEVEL